MSAPAPLPLVVLSNVVDQVANGFTEAFFEPVSQLTEVVDRLHSGFSTPGYALAVRVERVPVRMMIAIDSDMDKNRNVFRSAAAVVAATNDTGAARPSVGLLVLANLGAVRLHDGEHAPNGLSSSANAIRRRLDVCVSITLNTLVLF